MISGIQNPGKVKVTIKGQVYTIEGDASGDYIARVADYVNTKMDDIAKSVANASPLHIAILAALNIADELFQMRESEHMVTDEMIEKTNMLISMLDEGLVGDVFTISNSKR